MARLLGPKCKRCRREKEKLFLKGERCYTPKCAMVKRNYLPGTHGQKGKGMLTEYNLHLREKQKAKKIYGILEKQFKKYFQIAAKKIGETGEVLVKLLESRLDNVIFRLGFASSRSQARLLVSHNHIKVNGKQVNIPSYQVKVGDIIEIKESSKKNKYFQGIKAKGKAEDVPKWLKLNTKTLKGEVVSLPTSADLDKKINTQLIVEYYSR
ncbi:MAG: 30S ribosomal protein S4 [Patescibacteria group bacterium]